MGWPWLVSRLPESFPLRLSRSSAAESVPRTGPTVPTAMLTSPTRWRSPSPRATRRHLLRPRRRRHRLRAPLGERFSDKPFGYHAPARGHHALGTGLGARPVAPGPCGLGGWASLTCHRSVRARLARPCAPTGIGAGRPGRCPLGRCGAPCARHSFTTAADTGPLLRHRHSPPSSLATLWVDAARRRSLCRTDASNFPTLGICIRAFVLNAHR